MEIPHSNFYGDQYPLVWTNILLCGRLSSCLDEYPLVWTNILMFGRISSGMDEYPHVWTNIFMCE